MARKTTTSSEVKKRWMDANYKTYRVNLRYDTDQTIIDFMARETETRGATEIIREALTAYMNMNK